MAAADSKNTRVYSRSQCVVFFRTKDAYGGLSNMAGGYPLFVNGIDIRTSEALYQSCRFPHQAAIQKEVIAQTSPTAAKMVGRPHVQETRPDWGVVRVPLMRWSLRVKLAQNWTSFGDLLLETGNRPIVEESRKDDYWGAYSQDGGILVGHNVVGRLLMELRAEFTSDNRDALRTVAPLAIPDFLLYRQPIGVVTQAHMPELLDLFRPELDQRLHRVTG